MSPNGYIKKGNKFPWSCSCRTKRSGGLFLKFGGTEKENDPSVYDSPGSSNIAAGKKGPTEKEECKTEENHNAALVHSAVSAGDSFWNSQSEQNSVHGPYKKKKPSKIVGKHPFLYACFVFLEVPSDNFRFLTETYYMSKRLHCFE